MKTPRFWQSKTLASAALLPASWLYGLAAWADRRFTTPKRAPLPVISVGNVTAGGAGKTPTCLALIPLLRALGHTPHILTRGYGGARLEAHFVTKADSHKTVGDEALLLARAAPTWAGRNRLASATAATNAGATVLVCDDAHQHHALIKDISLLVIDGPYGLGNGRLLPAGPLREWVAAGISRADALLMIGENAQQFRAALPTFQASLQPTAELQHLRSNKWLAFAGIGRPEKFYTMLRNLGATPVETRDFPDHHAYTAQEIKTLLARAAALGASLITTEKDAVKLPETLRREVAVLPIALSLTDEDGFKQWLGERLARRRATS